jgi:hypothetical protein
MKNRGKDIDFSVTSGSRKSMENIQDFNTKVLKSVIFRNLDDD